MACLFESKALVAVGACSHSLILPMDHLHCLNLMKQACDICPLDKGNLCVLFLLLECLSNTVHVTVLICYLNLCLFASTITQVNYHDFQCCVIERDVYVYVAIPVYQMRK